MKLKLNMYVRTKKGIAKIIGRINDPTNYYDKYWVCDRYLELNNDTEYIHEQDIIGEPSYNIIDLIQVGDFVNGYPVYEIIEYEDNTRAIVIGDDNKSIIWEESSQYIKSIVTKEQFEVMKYKVEREEN